jgi:hypothetical protein
MNGSRHLRSGHCPVAPHNLARLSVTRRIPTGFRHEPTNRSVPVIGVHWAQWPSATILRQCRQYLWSLWSISDTEIAWPSSLNFP